MTAERTLEYIREINRLNDAIQGPRLQKSYTLKAVVCLLALLTVIGAVIYGVTK